MFRSLCGSRTSKVPNEFDFAVHVLCLFLDGPLANPKVLLFGYLCQGYVLSTQFSLYGYDLGARPNVSKALGKLCFPPHFGIEEGMRTNCVNESLYNLFTMK